MLKHTVEEVTLPNGAKGLFVDIKDASVMSFRINFRAGDVYTSSDEKWETAHIMEHLSLGANKSYPKSRDYQMELDKNGAGTNASTAHTEMIYEAECADFEWERFTKVFLGGISEPLFTQTDFEAECGNVYEELVGRGNNQGGRLYFEMAKVYGLNRKTMNERAELMKNVTVKDVRDHFAKTHFAHNMRFVISGNLAGRKKQITKMLCDMNLPKSKSRTRFELPKEKAQKVTDVQFIENPSVPNAYFSFETFMSSGATKSERYSANLLCTILTDTLYSRIFGVAREQGLIYYLSSGLDCSPHYSSWTFESQISEKQLSPFLKIMVNELRSVLDGNISQEDIDAAKLHHLGRFQRSSQTVSAITSNYAGRYFYDESINDYFTRFDANLAEVTKETMVEIAQKLFAENIWGLGILGTISEEARQSAHKQLAELWK